jgi:hypothetical protein
MRHGKGQIGPADTIAVGPCLFKEEIATDAQLGKSGRYRCSNAALDFQVASRRPAIRRRWGPRAAQCPQRSGIEPAAKFATARGVRLGRDTGWTWWQRGPSDGTEPPARMDLT